MFLSMIQYFASTLQQFFTMYGSITVYTGVTLVGISLAAYFVSLIARRFLG